MAIKCFHLDRSLKFRKNHHIICSNSGIIPRFENIDIALKMMRVAIVLTKKNLQTLVLDRAFERKRNKFVIKIHTQSSLQQDLVETIFTLFELFQNLIVDERNYDQRTQPNAVTAELIARE